MYEIKVLKSEEFDRVAKSDPRYSYVDESNMGFADRSKNIAYVRGTHLHDLNKYLVEHELEELMEDKSTHEDANGIRHKKFFNDFLQYFTTNPGGAFGGGDKPPEPPVTVFPQTVQSQQASAPQTVFAGQGGQQSPFGIPTESSQASSRTPLAGGSNISSPLGQGLNQPGFSGQIDPGLAERTRGFFAGRLTF